MSRTFEEVLFLMSLPRKALIKVLDAEVSGYMVEGPVQHIRRYTGPDASDCKVCGRPWCNKDNRMFKECEV